MFTTSNFWLISKTLFILNLFPLSLTEDLQEGDQCSFSDGSKGICKLTADCPSTLAQLRQGVFPENICRFLNTEPIVCCKDSLPSSTSRPPTQQTSTSRKQPRRRSLAPSNFSNPSVTTRTPGEISKAKCKQYARYSYGDSEPPILEIPTLVSHPVLLALRQEFPHMALIGYETKDGVSWGCGGSIISENFVLTAAHCLRSSLYQVKYVRAGIINKNNSTNLQERTVAEIIVHPNYTRSSKYHDIGLLRLSKDYDLNLYVRPACLQTEKRIPYEKAIVSGWGKTYFSGPVSDDLLKVGFELFDVTKCNNTYRREINAPDSSITDGIVDSLMVCAGSTKDSSDICLSGNPLQVYHEKMEDVKYIMYDIVGIASFGKACGLAKNIPSVYTRVSECIKWIEDTVWP